MPIYNVQKIIHTRLTYRVAADKPEDAIRMAENPAHPELAYESEKIGETPWQANLEEDEDG